MSAERVLDRYQVAHLRHWDNLSRRQTHDWSLMQGKGLGEDDFGGYRFQLSYMIYGLALVHRNRLPAAPGLFAPTIKRLIEKLLLPDVWMYWRDVSRGGSVFNAHLASNYAEEWNPVGRDNIMYSAYVQSCASMSDYLFGQDHYGKAGSLSFRHWSFFWGGPEKHFDYDRDSLTEHLYWQMVRNGYIGIACEPNCVFQICNQPAIIGFRMHDLITGRRRADEVVQSYEAAWQEFGRLDENGHYNMMVLEDSRLVRPNEEPSPWVDAWCGALMNSWNRDFVRKNYSHQVADFLERSPSGTTQVKSLPARQVMGQAVISDTCDFGWVAAWASEMGDRDTLDRLLVHADTFLAPTHLDGGLYYPRNDRKTDAKGNRTEIEPMSGNVTLGYARLNVEDGLWNLYNTPWPKDHFKQPALTHVARDVEVSQAEIIDGVLCSRLAKVRDVLASPGYRTLEDDSKVEPGSVIVGNLPRDFAVFLDGAPLSEDLLQRGGASLTVHLPHAGHHRLQVIPT